MITREGSMRALLAVIAGLAALAVLLLAACSSDDASSGAGTKSVVATTVQIAALTREVAREKLEVHGLIPPGADAHEFEPTASDLKAIEDAELILRHGIGLDDWLDDTLKAGGDANGQREEVATCGHDEPRREAKVFLPLAAEDCRTNRGGRLPACRISAGWKPAATCGPVALSICCSAASGKAP